MKIYPRLVKALFTFVFLFCISILSFNRLYAQRVEGKDIVLELNKLQSLAKDNFKVKEGQLNQLRELQVETNSKEVVLEDSLVSSTNKQIENIEWQLEQLSAEQPEFQNEMYVKLMEIDENLESESNEEITVSELKDSSYLVLAFDEVKVDDEKSGEEDESVEAAEIDFETDIIFENLEVYGFVDWQQLFSNESGTYYGQFELDVAKRILKNVSIEAAIAFNSEEQKFELGAGYVDVGVIGDGMDAPVRGAFLKCTGIIVGQFDVPFGIDYEYIPSPDRKFVTPPLSNQMTIDGLNDLGAIFYLQTPLFTTNIFTINGLTEGGFSVGGRFGLTPFEEIDLGMSFLTDGNNFADVSAQVYGLDLRIFLNSLELRSEYTLSNGIINGEIDELGIGSQNDGYYFQATYDFQEFLCCPFFIALRYGEWNNYLRDRNDNTLQTIKRITAGLGYSFSEVLGLRAEYLNEIYSDDWSGDRFTVQLVVTF